ncbi:hypothetical protein BKA57DRAFT_453218 [Linnemannia elongata]|nr:hypothetical protein BKA57DRAFT_453218 [Linnemannia elongata]
MGKSLKLVLVGIYLLTTLPSSHVDALSCDRVSRKVSHFKGCYWDSCGYSNGDYEFVQHDGKILVGTTKSGHIDNVCSSNRGSYLHGECCTGYGKFSGCWFGFSRLWCDDPEGRAPGTKCFTECRFVKGGGATD